MYGTVIKKKIKAYVKNDIYKTIPKAKKKYLKVTINYEGPIKAPIKEGQQIGNLILESPNEEVKKFPIYASKSVKKVNFFKSLFLSFNYMIWGDA